LVDAPLKLVQVSLSTCISARGEQHFSKMRSNLAYKLHIVMQPSNILLLTNHSIRPTRSKLWRNWAECKARFANVMSIRKGKGSQSMIDQVLPS
jgi:hypothetical protein